MKKFFSYEFSYDSWFLIYEEALLKAIEYEASEVVKILITNEELDINHKFVLII